LEYYSKGCLKNRAAPIVEEEIMGQARKDGFTIQDTLRAIPAIDRLVVEATLEPAFAKYPRQLITAAAREAVSAVRETLRQSGAADATPAGLLAAVSAILHRRARASLRRVINATGVVLHTNLGRAPLSQRACTAVTQVMAGYSTLEYDLDTGGRGSRYRHVEDKICQLTGAEAALVVNNNAAAILLALSTLANGREVIVSRGQLVEIGGSFRIPDVLRQSGARLVEVGTTNKTHLADYEGAIGADSAAILKVHTSNYRIVGFASQPAAEQLVELAHSRNIPVLDDLGSGTLLALNTGDWQEPTVGEAIHTGLDVVTFSGDKLLGAGQAGIIVGRAEYVAKMKGNPLLRALRIDKLSLAALEGTLQDYIIGNAIADIPAQSMLRRRPEELRRQANALADHLEPLKGGGWTISVVALESQAGGGALPAVGLASYGVSIGGGFLSESELEHFLRQRPIPVIVHVQNGKVLFDVRCLLPGDQEEIIAACWAAAEDQKP